MPISTGPISERLKKIMELRGYRAVDLCRETGISKSVISSYLNNVRFPKINKLHLIAEALDVDVFWLLGVDTDPSDSGEANDIPQYMSINAMAKSTVASLLNGEAMTYIDEFFGGKPDVPAAGSRPLKAGDPGELTLLTTYRNLNDKGKERLLERAGELSELPKYAEERATGTLQSSA
jgi:transcriptional regulator with XRE-family HTH domain